MEFFWNKFALCIQLDYLSPPSPTISQTQTPFLFPSIFPIFPSIFPSIFPLFPSIFASSLLRFFPSSLLRFFASSSLRFFVSSALLLFASSVPFHFHIWFLLSFPPARTELLQRRCLERDISLGPSSCKKCVAEILGKVGKSKSPEKIRAQ